MKTVWVNRSDADGIAKPLDEWVMKTCATHLTHYSHGDDGAIWSNPACNENFTVDGNLVEYIYNQRGNGWFYPADNHWPTVGVEVWTLDDRSCDFNKDYIEINADTCSKYFVKGGENVVCWMPIQRPSINT